MIRKRFTVFMFLKSAVYGTKQQWFPSYNRQYAVPLTVCALVRVHCCEIRGLPKYFAHNEITSFMKKNGKRYRKIQKEKERKESAYGSGENAEMLNYSRRCSHEIEAQRKRYLIWSAARNDAVFLAYLVAILRHCFKWTKAVSTRCRALWRALSYSRCSFRFFLEGKYTPEIPRERGDVYGQK